MEKDLEYERNNVGYDEHCTLENGGGIKCKNYELCDSVLPLWWWDCKNMYLCTDCHMRFGTWGHGINSHTGKGILPILDNVDCPICLDHTKCVTYPRCDHYVCIECFKRCWFGDNSGQPPFPYPEMEEEYYDDQDNQKWKEYPLLKVYDIDCDSWELNRTKKYEREQYLRNCTVCRL
jgi:hypothetical protein